MPDFNFTSPDFDRPYDFVAHYAAHTPDSDALVYQGQRISYRDLQRQVDDLARAMIAAGIHSGDRVATLSTPHPDCAKILLATMSIGAILVGLNPRYQLGEMEHVIKDALPKLLFSRSQIGKRNYDEEITSLLKSRGKMKAVVIVGDPALDCAQSLDNFVARSNSVTEETLHERRTQVTGEWPGLIVYTSGTTGKPKGALLKQSATVRHGKLSLAEFKPDPLRVINYYPINHVAGVVANTLYTLVGGGANILMEQFSPATVLETIEQEKVTQWGAIPTMYQLCMEHPDFLTRDLSSVQFISWGGSAAPEPMIATLAARFPYLSTLYAMTETTGGVMQIAPCQDIDLLAKSVGKPLPDCECRLVDELGTVVAPGEIGEIQVRGPFLMLEYWNNPQATEDTFTEDGWLKTGDLGTQSADGNVFIVGRSKDMYKSGGFNVYPREIERALEAKDQINMVAVVSVPDPLYNEVGHAFVTLDGSNSSITEDELKAHCTGLLANYKVPKAFHICSELPLLPNGKIDKKLLSQRARESIAN